MTAAALSTPALQRKADREAVAALDFASAV
jgi:hypothetical protein